LRNPQPESNPPLLDELITKERDTGGRIERPMVCLRLKDLSKQGIEVFPNLIGHRVMAKTMFDHEFPSVRGELHSLIGLY
jgi:hypothetical protein